MSNAENKPLVDLIVGKAVRDAEGQRYVREAGRDVVYVIEIDPAKLSTNFEDWIEKDLLKLNAWDLQQVDVKDYSAEMGLVMTPEGRPSIGAADVGPAVRNDAGLQRCRCQVEPGQATELRFQEGHERRLCRLCPRGRRGTKRRFAEWTQERRSMNCRSSMWSASRRG